MIRYFFIGACLLVLSCSGKDYDKTVFTVWESEDETWCGNYLFGINDSLYVHRNYSPNQFELTPKSDYGYELISDLSFQPINISADFVSVNSLRLASYSGEVRWPMIGELYNLEIKNSIWNVDLYWEASDIKGSYRFEVNNDEKRLTLLLLQELNQNLDRSYFPATEDQASPTIYASALYVALDDQEYFGTTYVDPCEFMMIHQWVVQIIEKYLSPEYKVSNDLIHLDIRERFNEFVEKDDITGFFLFDYDEVKREIEEYSRNDE